MRKSFLIFLSILAVLAFGLNTKYIQAQNIDNYEIKEGVSSAGDFYIEAIEDSKVMTTFWCLPAILYRGEEYKLIYVNKFGEEVAIYLDNIKNNKVKEMKFGLIEKYYCSEKENYYLCLKAQLIVEYWRKIMNWDKKVEKFLETRRLTERLEIK